MQSLSPSLLRRRAFALGLLAVSGTPSLFAQEPYPSRPVLIINPWAAGGPADAVIRPIAEKLSQRFGQQFVVESRSGANGTIGAAAVAKARPDGYTLFFAHVGPVAISPALPAKLPYDPLKDFAPITQMVSGPTVLVVRSDFPAKTLAEFIEYAKANPGKLAYGSVGNGSTTHLASATLAHATGMDMVHAPYRGSALVNTDLLGGQIQAAFVGVAGVVALVNDGRLRPLAVSTAKRVGVLPNVPTVAETVPGFDFNSWYGLMAPAGTPQAIVNRLNAEVVQILKLPEIVSRLNGNGLEVEGSSPEAFAAKVREDLARWSAAVKLANVKD